MDEKTANDLAEMILGCATMIGGLHDLLIDKGICSDDEIMRHLAGLEARAASLGQVAAPIRIVRRAREEKQTPRH